MHKDISKAFEKLVYDFYSNNERIIDRTDSSMKANEGKPDIEIKDKLYIECTVANKGEKSDGVSLTAYTFDVVNQSTWHCIPEEVEQARTKFIYQRIANRLYEKQQKFTLNEKNINKDLPRVVALTLNLEGLSKDYEYIDIYEDMFCKLLWDNGPGVTLRKNLGGAWYETPNKDDIVIHSNLGAELKSIFKNNEINFKKISAVLFVCPSKVKSALEYSLSLEVSDMFLCINKFAEKNITENDWRELGSPKILSEVPKLVRQ